jgi:hypothetical protein
MNDRNLEITDVIIYNKEMSQDGAWAGQPEIYAAAWFYKVDIMIYSKEYISMGGSLVFNLIGPVGGKPTDRPMLHISYHDNNHFNSVRPPISNNPNCPVYLNGMERLKSDMQHAIDDHQDEFEKIILNAIAESGPMFPKDKINPIRANSRRIMTYIAGELSSATNGRQSFSESQLELICNQAKERALHNSQQGVAPSPPQVTQIPQTALTIPDATPPAPSMVERYEADLQSSIL